MVARHKRWYGLVWPVFIKSVRSAITKEQTPDNALAKGPGRYLVSEAQQGCASMDTLLGGCIGLLHCFKQGQVIVKIFELVATEVGRLAAVGR